MVPIHSVLCSNNGDVLRSAALNGRGIAILPTFLVGPDIEDGRLETVLYQFPQPELGVHAFYASNRYLARGEWSLFARAAAHSVARADLIRSDRSLTAPAWKSPDQSCVRRRLSNEG